MGRLKLRRATRSAHPCPVNRARPPISAAETRATPNLCRGNARNPQSLPASGADCGLRTFPRRVDFPPAERGWKNTSSGPCAKSQGARPGRVPREGERATPNLCRRVAQIAGCARFPARRGRVNTMTWRFYAIREGERATPISAAETGGMPLIWRGRVNTMTWRFYARPGWVPREGERATRDPRLGNTSEYNDLAVLCRRADSSRRSDAKTPSRKSKKALRR